MVKQSLWAEILIGGFLYLLGLLFITLWYYDLDSSIIIYSFKEYLPLITIIGIVFSYILGFFVHRIIYILLSFKDNISYDDIVMIRQFGSADLLDTINHQYRHILFSRLLIVGMFILGISILIWSNNTWPLSILLILLSVSSIFITIKQKKDYKQLLDSTINLIKEKVESKK